MNKSILALLLLFAFSTSYSQKRELTLEKIWLKGTFSAKSVRGLTSMKDGLHYTVLEDKGEQQQINKYSYASGKLVSSILKNDLKNSNGEEIKIQSYQFSDDEKMLLIMTNAERIYRHSMKSDYYAYDLGKKKLTRIGTEKCQLAKFSPNSKYISYVRDNNLYLFDLSTGKEKTVTTDGKWNFIINGAPDWVYEEEFVLVRAYEWSPDGKHLAYYRFDESGVKEFSFPMYTGLYPENYVYKYPKAGEDNALVEIHCFTPESGTSEKINLGVSYEYVPRITWTSIKDVISVQVMNRLQNKMDLIFSNVVNGTSNKVLTQNSRTYLEVSDYHFIKDSKTFIGLSEESGFNQLYRYEISTTQNEKGDHYAVAGKKSISPANRDVSAYIGLNEKTETIYYEAFFEKDPTGQELLAYDLKSGKNDVFTLPKGSNHIEASQNMQYFITNHSTSEEPLSVILYDKSGNRIRVLEENKDLRDTLKNYEFGKKEFFSFTGRSGDVLNGWMIKPADFNANKKYPVLMYVYGGPGSQTVTQGWGGSNELWYQYLAQQGYIIVSVDNRGTGGRGARFRDCTYKQLGKLETEDQIDGAMYLGGLDFVDKARIGIWGWSYGGYMSTLCLAKGNPYFKMAIAVAPVSNWRFYDSIYTERYMGLPKNNGDGYDDNSPINHVDKIKGPYLLVHGTADDNVHFQNTTELIDALVQNNVQFDLGVYPDKNHGIYGGNTRYHLFTKMTDFIKENL